VARELTGLSQERLAALVGTSQSSLATIESGNRMPSVRSLLRIADATGFDLVLGLRHRDATPADPDVLRSAGFAVIGSLHGDPHDGLADLEVLREPTVFEGPPDR
jgi:transcriptional regulator with XRE-family HTH domain